MSNKFIKLFLIFFASFFIISAVNVQPVHAYQIYSGSTYQYKDEWVPVNSNSGIPIATKYYYSPSLPANSTITNIGSWESVGTYHGYDSSHGDCYIYRIRRLVEYDYKVY